MAENERSNDKKGKRQGPPDITVRDSIFGEPEPLPGGTFEIGISVLVLVGSRPAYGLNYQFLVNGLAQGNPQLISEGKATATLQLSGKRPAIAIEVWGPKLGRRLIPLKELGLLSEKVGKAAKLEVVATMSKGESLTIILARVNGKGEGVPGFINYLDDKPGNSESEPQLYRKKTNKFGTAIFDFDFGPVKRKVTFFLPEKPTEKIEKEIPAKSIEKEIPAKSKEVAGEITQEKPAKTSEESLKVRILDAYRRGRTGGVK